MSTTFNDNAIVIFALYYNKVADALTLVSITQFIGKERLTQKQESNQAIQ